jgi:MoaA/NifB/PqqE/SkfB family radical SAM enzyme
MKFPWYKYKELPLSKRNTLQIFITNVCNLKCDGCFAREVMKKDSKAYISMEEYCSAIKTAMNKGVKQINILGGEPLLHNSLHLMCEYNKLNNLKTTIYTNGTLLGNNYPIEYFHGAKLRVSLDSFKTTKKCVDNLIKSNFPINKIDANFMTTTETTLSDLYNSANVLENYGCRVFFIFNMQELKNNNQEFFDCSGNKLVLPVLDYKNLVHKFLEVYNGDMEIHISKRGVFESTLSLPHNKCKFANYFIDGKIIQCPYDVINLKYQDDYEFDKRYCQQNSTCLMSKIKVQRRKECQ